MTSKYDPLGAFLRGRYQDEVRITFEEIEGVLGFPLPPSARHRAWWSNNDTNNVMTKVWLDAGFQTEQVDIAGERLVFVRLKEEGKMTSDKPGFAEDAITTQTAVQGVTRHPAFGAMKGLITIMAGVDLTEPADPEWASIAYGEDEDA